MLDVLDDLENYLFEEEGDNFNCLAAAATTFRQGNQQSASTLCSGGSTLEARIMQVKAKHKYRPQNLFRFHLQGCSCVLKRPPTLPRSKNTHYNDCKRYNVNTIKTHCERFATAVISQIFSILRGAWQCKSGQMVQKFPVIPVKARKRKYLQSNYFFSRKLSTWMNHSI